MAIDFYEKQGSGQSKRSFVNADDTTGQRVYICNGTEDSETVYTLAQGMSPTWMLVGGRILNRGNIQPTPILPNVWEVLVEYTTKKQDDQEGELSRSFETAPGSQHIVQSLSTVSSYKDAALAGAIPNHQGAIGVTRDSVDGCDVPVPEARYSISRTIPLASFTTAYQRAVTLMTATWNDATFKGYPSGEVLFNGMTASQSGDNPVLATYSFSISPNRTNLTVGPINGINKRGWDYVWIQYRDVTNGQAMRKVPAYAYVEQVLYSSDFSVLGLGV